MEPNLARGEPNFYGIDLQRCEGANGTCQTRSSKTSNETVVFKTYKEAAAYWDHAACQAVYDLHFARAVCEKALTLCPRDRKVFNDWIDGRRPFMPKRLSKLSYPISLPSTWKQEAESLAAQYGSIAEANLTVLLIQARQELMDQQCTDATEKFPDERSMARCEVQ